MAMSLFVCLIFTVIGLLFGHIILFDSIFFSLIVGIICKQILDIHIIVWPAVQAPNYQCRVLDHQRSAFCIWGWGVLSAGLYTDRT